MSNIHRTQEEYTSLFANQHAAGNKEAAAEHAIVKEVCKELREEPEK